MATPTDNAAIATAPPKVVFAYASGPDHGLRRRRAYGDMVRILGTIAVVTGHVCDMKLGDNVLSGKWWFVNLLDSASRFAVPAYIMLSGALLLDPEREQSPAGFYSRRLARIGIPLVFWSAFFMWFSVYYTGWVNPPWKVWLNLLAGRPYTHMHFIFRITALYALTPMIRVFLKHAPRTMVIAAVAVLLALGMADSVRNAFTATDLSAFINFYPFLGFYLGGYLLRDVQISSRQAIAAGLTTIGCILALALGTGWLVSQYKFQWYPSPSMLLYDFLSPVRVVMAFAAWLFLTHVFRNPWPRSPQGQDAVRWLASATLGLYLIHPMFREMILFPPHFQHGYWMHRIWQGLHLAAGQGRSPWIAIPMEVASVYVLALLSTAILMKIPYVRRITG